jgi:hypothetical protein
MQAPKVEHGLSLFSTTTKDQVAQFFLLPSHDGIPPHKTASNYKEFQSISTNQLSTKQLIF